VDGQELVVLVRDTGITWVAATAESIRAGGAAVGLVTTGLTPQEQGWIDGLVEEVAIIDDLGDAAQIADAAERMSRGRTLSAVLSPSDGGMVAAARAAETLGVGRVSSAALALSRNKYGARVAMRAAGLPTPPFALLHDAESAAAVAAEVGLPAVIKPVNGTGSHLVEPVGTVDELAAAYRGLAARLLDTVQLRHIYSRSIDGGDGATIDPTGTFLVEGMLRGEEYCVDVIIRDGRLEPLPLMHKILIDDRFFEHGFVSPPIDLDPDREKLILGAVGDAILALGLDNTLAHVEVIDDEDAGPTVVEVNGGRPGGQIIGLLYGMATGINTGAELVALSRGLPSPRTTPRLPIPLASLTLFAKGNGRLRAIHGLDELADLDGVIQVIPAVRPGDLLSDDHEIFAVNFVVAGFMDLDDLQDTYELATGLVRIEVDPI